MCSVTCGRMWASVCRCSKLAGRGNSICPIFIIKNQELLANLMNNPFTDFVNDRMGGGESSQDSTYEPPPPLAAGPASAVTPAVAPSLDSLAYASFPGSSFGGGGGHYSVRGTGPNFFFEQHTCTPSRRRADMGASGNTRISGRRGHDGVGSGRVGRTHGRGDGRPGQRTPSANVTAQASARARCGGREPPGQAASCRYRSGLRP